MMEQMTNSISLNIEKEIRESCKLISYLLQYPDKRWLHWKELVEEAMAFNNPYVREPFLAFLEEIGKLSLDDLEQHYVNLFDFNSNCALSLSYLKAGEQRERGQILVELKAMYKSYGYEMTEEELSDYLPVVLEFASVAPLQISANLLGSFNESIGKLKNELETQKSPYATLLDACLANLKTLEDYILLGGEGTECNNFYG